MGMTDADGSEFYKNAGHVEGITGYYDVTDDEDVYMANFDKAVETLKKYTPTTRRTASSPTSRP